MLYTYAYLGNFTRYCRQQLLCMFMHNYPLVGVYAHVFVPVHAHVYAYVCVCVCVCMGVGVSICALEYFSTYFNLMDCI